VELDLAYDSEVRDHHSRTDLAGQHVNSCPTIQEVPNHLRGHRLWVGRHLFRCDSMIAGEHDHGFVGEVRLGRARDTGELDGERLQPTQAAGRFGELVEAQLCCCHRRRVEWLDAGDCVLK
jgi:hypothetical protein